MSNSIKVQQAKIKPTPQQASLTYSSHLIEAMVVLNLYGVRMRLIFYIVWLYDKLFKEYLLYSYRFIIVNQTMCD